MVYSAKFFVNTSAVEAGAAYIATGFSKAVPTIKKEMRNLVKQIMIQEFAAAGQIGNQNGGFPPAYQEHLLANVSQIEPFIWTDSHGVIVEFDLEEELGGHDDLTRAYHQGAYLADGSKLWGPYEGQALKQDNDAERHVYWEALRRGETSVAPANRSGRVKLEGNWEDTIQQYLEIWGDKSPQWLFLQFGQEEWDPYIPQVDIINNIEDAVQATAVAYLASVFQSIVDVANKYKTAGLDVGYTGDTGPPRVKSGTVEHGGKVYRPGRFVPKGGF